MFSSFVRYAMPLLLAGGAFLGWDAARAEPAAHGSQAAPQADANPCALRVETRLASLFSAGVRREDGAWEFAWRKPLPPAGLTPQQVLGTRGVFSWTHVQGFTPTYAAALPYAISHNDDDHGAVLLVRRSERALTLSAIHGLRTPHPSGVHVIGRYVAVADDNDLVLIDLSAPAATTALRHALPKPGLRRAGAGIGLAKLKDGSHLLVASRPGNYAPGPRVTRFFKLHGGLVTPTRTEFLGESVYSEPAAWTGDHRYSENLSVITECGTGALYTVHTTGADRLLGDG
jgi:hypothetical protein